MLKAIAAGSARDPVPTTSGSASGEALEADEPAKERKTKVKVVFFKDRKLEDSPHLDAKGR